MPPGPSARLGLPGIMVFLALLAFASCDFGTPIQGGGGTEGEGLSGILVDEGGAPVVGALVRAFAAADSSPGLARRAATAATVLDSSLTNSRGLFDLRHLQPGVYNLAASIRRGDTTLALFIPGVAYAGGKQGLGTDTLRPTGSAALQVWVGDSLLVGAVCFVAGSPYRAVTDEEGGCLIEGIPAGSYRIVVAYPGYNLSLANASVIEPGLTSSCGAIDVLAEGGPVAWTPRNSGTPRTLTAVTWTGDQVVAVGNEGTILTSTDGTTWVQRVSGTPGNLYGIASSDGRMVAVGENGGNGIILTSEDGVSWLSQASPGNAILHGVIWDGNRFMAVGRSGTILISPDGLGWSNAASGTNGSLWGVAWAGNQYLVFGYDRLLTSSDGASWASRTYVMANPSARDLYGIAWSGERYVAVGSNNTIMTSADGATWTLRTSESNVSLNGISAEGHRMVVVGSEGAILSSPQGLSWTREISGTLQHLQAVAWTGVRHVAVGYGGTILTSP